MMNELLDKLRRPFRPGQLVAYPHRKGSNCTLKLAELIAVRHDGSLTAQNARGRQVRLKKLSEVAIVYEPVEARLGTSNLDAVRRARL